MTAGPQNSLLKELDAANRLGVSVRTLQGWRTTGRGPAFIRLSGAVRYAGDDLEAFIRAGRRISTSPPTAAGFPMTAAIRKAKRRPARPAVESAIYDGSLMLGEVLPRRGSFVARLVGGRRLGAFATEQLAMRAITTAARNINPTITKSE